MLSNNMISKYDKGFITDEGMYDRCDTDLEFYKFLKNHCEYDEDGIFKIMYEVSCASDAYNSARSDYLYELYDEFIEETEDKNGEVDNNYFKVWLEERGEDIKDVEIKIFD